MNEDLFKQISVFQKSLTGDLYDYVGKSIDDNTLEDLKVNMSQIIEQYMQEQERLEPPDRIMRDFQKKVNDSPNWHVKLNWKKEMDTRGYWGGYSLTQWTIFAKQAHEKGVITWQQLIDVFLALQARGATNEDCLTIMQETLARQE